MIGPLGEMCGACHYADLVASTSGIKIECHGWGKKLKSGGNASDPADWTWPLPMIDEYCFHFRLFGTGDPGHYP